ncbi:hypothetical protein Btru_027533 [Bulinus truncatus]|nr:hypothetical protein Btru_027533 [Bulinus truncatus]
MPKRYVDNALNRRLGRVGMIHGTAVHSSSGYSSSSNYYVDNALNRSLGRVGLPHGSAVYSRNDNTLTVQMGALCLLDSRVYVDNSFNRKHNRVGKPLGSAPILKQERIYKDNPVNRNLGRVGLPWGKYRGIYQDELLQKLREHAMADTIPNELVEKYQDDKAAKETIQNFSELTKRNNYIRNWLEEHKTSTWNAHQHTSKDIIDKYSGTVINFSDLKLNDQIGHGGYGDVYTAEWKEDELVAVKKFRNQRISKKRLQQFQDEIRIFCKLDHRNIVRFLGACIETPDLAIVMEYMDMSLHEALHTIGIEFTENDKISIMRDVTLGLDYLHDKSLAHCDMKTANVLLNNVPGQETTETDRPVLAKITDFGLSLMKSDTESSSSSAAICNIGTPRYSAPEVLRGEMLNVKQLMKADVYSTGLVIFELLLEEIAFEDLTVLQLRKQVGENELKPPIKKDFLEAELGKTLEKCWSRSPDDRPSTKALSSFAESCMKLYAEM